MELCGYCRVDIISFHDKEEDPDCDGDGITGFYIDGKFMFSGDYYHDKIDDYIQGYIDGMIQAGMTVEVNRHSPRAVEDILNFPQNFAT